MIEDALAFLSDAGLVGRLTMSQQERWISNKDVTPELKHKLAECIWWLAVLSKRMDIDLKQSMETFYQVWNNVWGNNKTTSGGILHI